MSLPSTNPGPLVAEVDPGRFRYSMWGNLSIGIWQDQATREAAERILALSRRNTERFPHGHSSLIFILKGAPAPTEEANAVFEEMYRPQNHLGLGCLGLVLEGEGFWASAMRSTALGMRMRSGSDMAVRAGDSVEELLPWFVAEHFQRTGVEFSTPRLHRILLSVRQHGTAE